MFNVFSLCRLGRIPPVSPLLPKNSITNAAQLEIKCRDCGASLTLPAERFTAICPYCASPSVVDRPAGSGNSKRVRPDYVLGFDITPEEASRRVKAWIGRSRMFAPSGVRQAQVTDVQGIYLPAWLYGSVARTHYEAQIGENYTTTETYTTTDGKGKISVHTRVVVRTEYRHLAGDHVSYLLDVLVTASQGLGNQELESIEPFDLRALRRFEHAMVSGWAAEEATLSRDEGFELARTESMDLIVERLREFLPGDSATLKSYGTDFTEESTDLLMLPIYVFAARYGKNQTLRILVNGQTGEVQGLVPRSGVKLALAVILGLGLMVALVLFFLEGGDFG